MLLLLVLVVLVLVLIFASGCRHCPSRGGRLLVWCGCVLLEETAEKEEGRKKNERPG